MAYLLVLEISKKQDYIFKSNRLAESIGASSIVKYITEELPGKYLKENNGDSIYEGGGKSLYIFYSKENASNFTKHFSRYIIENFSGIELFITGHEFDEEKEDIIGEIDCAYEKLEIKKSQRKYNTGLLGFGINERCRSTGLPAYCADNKSSSRSYISKEIKTKLEHNGDNAFQSIALGGYTFPKDIEDIKLSENKKSYIAIVHIDGNRMGQKINKFKLKNKLKENENVLKHNKEYIKKFNELSQNIKTAYENAFKKMNEYIVNNYMDKEDRVLLVRPIILAGDDVCFICDASIALECSKVFIEELNTYSIDGERLHACAGISIVKHHYPFSRAYDLAEQLCKNAKSEIDGEDTSLIDWHISQGDISGSIEDIRNSYYYCTDSMKSKLTMRPIYLDSRKSWRNYNNIKFAMECITKNDVARSKIKELRDVLRQGRESTEIFVKTNGLQNTIHRLEGVQGSYGFSDDNICMYYDAIEMMDFCVNTKEV